MDIIPGTPYKILQSEDHFKYGVDSILLSSFAKMNKGKSLVDIGTGVGILALRCHYLYDLDKVYAFEIQEDLARLAQDSVRENGLEDSIEIIAGDVRECFDFQTDYIITNPPYIEEGRGIINKNPAKEIAFHEKFLKLEDIFSLAKKNLRHRGRLFMVNRANRLVDSLEEGRRQKIEPVRIRMVQSFVDSKAHLFMAEFVKDGGKYLSIDPALVIYNKDGSYTDEIEEIYRLG